MQEERSNSLQTNGIQNLGIGWQFSQVGLVLMIGEDLGSFHIVNCPLGDRYRAKNWACHSEHCISSVLTVCVGSRGWSRALEKV